MTVYKREGERALVVGGSGFIGIHVIDALLASGWVVASTRRKSTPTLLLRKRPVELLSACLQDRASLVRAMSGRDIVVVCAGHYPRYSSDRDSAVKKGALEIDNALGAAHEAGVRRVVYTSSIAVLGYAESGLADEQNVRTSAEASCGVYAAVKREMEGVVSDWRVRGLDVVSIVAGGCLGAWDLRVGTTGVLMGLLNGTLPFWTEGWVNLVDVHDIARTHVAAIDAREPHYCAVGHNMKMSEFVAFASKRYNVAAPPQVSAQVARQMSDLAERHAEPRRVRVGMPREFVDLVTSGQRVSSNRATVELGIAWTPFEETLDRTRDWLVRHRYVPGPTQERRKEASCPLT